MLEFLFLTDGLGGNEIAALRVIEELHNIGATVSIKLNNNNQRMLIYIEKTMPMIKNISKVSKEATVVIVSSSYLSAIKYLVVNRVIYKRYYIYTPFFGFEWTKNIVEKQIRKVICKIFHYSIYPFRVSLLAPYDSMFDFISLRCNIDFVLPNVVDSNSYVIDYNKSADNNEKIYLYVIARVEYLQKSQNKILHLFEDAVSIMNKEKYELHFIGDGPDFQDLLGLTKNKKNIKCHGWVEKPIKLKQNSIVIMGSELEGLPLVALEAIYAGLAVISTDNCGLNAFLPTQCIFDNNRYETFMNAIVFVENNWNDIKEEILKKIITMHSERRLNICCKEFLEKRGLLIKKNSR